MMKTLVQCAIAMLMGMGTVTGEPPARPAPEVTLTGEVVDLHCYLARGARGADHASCANACLSRGVTPGFLTEDGQLLVLLAERPVSPKETLAGLAGERATLKGSLVDRDGVRGVQLKSIERTAKP